MTDQKAPEMIERVARALWLDYWDGDACAWEDAEESARETSRSLARAAFHSMMEPTDAMLRRGSAAAEFCDNGWESNATWMAMINSALEDK